MLVLFLIILLSNFSLGLAVYLRNPQGKINKIFFAFVFGVTVWVLSNYLENERVRIKVADSGTGIPEKHLSKIFDPFFTTKEPREGTGLGLALVHTIIERWGGTIQVESRGVKGTTFTIEFPIFKEELSQEEINAPTN